ncbi:hypothetical protein PInf_021087 [Phytophthora infestans]|nr:hypothetical protein PInf_021087 [Phytophthora infestans]
MVFVNYGGGGFAIFTHSIWDGLTIADLVFPWFAWILGFSIFLSSDTSRGISKLESLGRIGQRASKLFALGLFINNGDSWSEWRIPGVLQALSVAYLAVATADWLLPLHDGNGIKKYRALACHLIVGVLPLVLVNLLLTFTLHVPGCPTGYIGPGGDADAGVHRNCTGGAHLYVDSLVFGLRHIFQTPTCQKRYQTGPYDPEGLLNWLMVAATAYFGYLQAAFVAKIREQDRQTVSAASDSGFKNRTTVLLAGDSIMELATNPSVDGFISLLAGRYSRSADMIVRALSGYNTRWFLKYAMPGIEEEITREGILDRSNAMTKLYARACVEAAKEAGVSVLDLYSHFDAMTVTARDKVLVDGVHFNAAGHLVVDEKLRATILKEFPKVNDLLDTYQFPIVSRWMKDDPYVPETTK